MPTTLSSARMFENLGIPIIDEQHDKIFEYLKQHIPNAGEEKWHRAVLWVMTGLGAYAGFRLLKSALAIDDADFLAHQKRQDSPGEEKIYGTDIQITVYGVDRLYTERDVLDSGYGDLLNRDDIWFYFRYRSSAVGSKGSYSNYSDIMTLQRVEIAFYGIDEILIEAYDRSKENFIVGSGKITREMMRRAVFRGETVDEWIDMESKHNFSKIRVLMECPSLKGKFAPVLPKITEAPSLIPEEILRQRLNQAAQQRQQEVFNRRKQVTLRRELERKKNTILKPSALEVIRKKEERIKKLERCERERLLRLKQAENRAIHDHQEKQMTRLGQLQRIRDTFMNHGNAPSQSSKIDSPGIDSNAMSEISQVNGTRVSENIQSGQSADETGNDAIPDPYIGDVRFQHYFGKENPIVIPAAFTGLGDANKLAIYEEPLTVSHIAKSRPNLLTSDKSAQKTYSAPQTFSRSVVTFHGKEENPDATKSSKLLAANSSKLIGYTVDGKTQKPDSGAAIHLTLRFIREKNQIHVHVHEVVNYKQLLRPESENRQPYVSLRLHPQDLKRKTSRAKNKDADPHFNDELVTLSLGSQFSWHQLTLDVKVKAHISITHQPIEIAFCTINLYNLRTDDVVNDAWYPLETPRKFEGI